MAEIKVAVVHHNPTTEEIVERAAEMAALWPRYLPPLSQAPLAVTVSSPITALVSAIHGGMVYQWVDLPSGFMPGLSYRFFIHGYVYLRHEATDNVVGTLCVHVQRIWTGMEKVVGLYYMAKYDEKKFLEMAVFTPTPWGQGNIKGLQAPYLKPELMR